MTEKKKSTILKDALILFLITLIAGSLLGLVNQITLEPIAKSELKAKEEAYQVVFADSSKFEENSQIKDKLKSATFDGAEVTEVLEAKDADGNTVGYVMSITAKEGYGGDIQFTMGVRNDGTINGISILSIAETPGLGMNAEKVLKPQFAGKTVEKFEYTKTGATADNQVDAISGATITTNAIVNGVNAGLSYFMTELGGGVSHE